MFLWWGHDLVQIYNDAYRPSLGADHHPAALGAHGNAFFSEIWPMIGPQTHQVLGRSARELELEQANMQLQENAVELEAQTEELNATAASLEEKMEEAIRAATALAESEERFRSVQDASPDASLLGQAIRDESPGSSPTFAGVTRTPPCRRCSSEMPRRARS